MSLPRRKMNRMSNDSYNIICDESSVDLLPSYGFGIKDLTIKRVSVDTLRSLAHFINRLAEALDKIASVLSQQRPSQLTKVKPPPTWAAESFTDYKAEVDSWEQAHPGEEFVKYSEFLNELKRNKTKTGLSDYVSTIVIDKTRKNKTVQSLLDALR